MILGKDWMDLARIVSDFQKLDLIRLLLSLEILESIKDFYEKNEILIFYIKFATLIFAILNRNLHKILYWKVIECL